MYFKSVFLHNHTSDWPPVFCFDFTDLWPWNWDQGQRSREFYKFRILLVIVIQKKLLQIMIWFVGQITVYKKAQLQPISVEVFWLTLYEFSPLMYLKSVFLRNHTNDWPGVFWFEITDLWPWNWCQGQRSIWHSRF